tara:strand:+ start:127 stop:525 length:399 start_codon:yes stop_codon:yes gene_type:complete
LLKKIYGWAPLVFSLLYIPLSTLKHKPLDANLSYTLETTTMKNIINQLINDEAGFIVSAELVLISSIAVLAMIVGLSEVANNVNQELEDVGSAFASIDQSYKLSNAHGHKACTDGSRFNDCPDFCSGQWDVQ